MTALRPKTDYFMGLLRELRQLPQETQWVEFKRNNADPKMIGENLSALANAAAINNQSYAYLLWGIDDSSHDIVGTSFDPVSTKKSNEPLENWLQRLLNPRIYFYFETLEVESRRVVFLVISPATNQPVAFNGTEYIRVGEAKKPLREAPELERKLWRTFERTPFENGVASERTSDNNVLQLLDYPTYFDLLGEPLPANRNSILEALENSRIITRSEAGGWNITNMGAILLAKNLEDFDNLSRKAVRVIQYQSTNRTNTIREQRGRKGYACGFEGLINYIQNLLPASETIEQALRTTAFAIPELAIRELVANGLIHQDFSVTGVGPMVEIFSDRVEITNPGEPLVDTQRFLDTPPQSRNEALASLMRRFRICEERGGGIDKVVSEVERCHLPAPLFESPKHFTRTVLFMSKPLTAMSREDRMRACYLHASLKYVAREYLTNASLRLRLGIDERNKSMVSRYIREAVNMGLIVPLDYAARKTRKYVPFWA